MKSLPFLILWLVVFAASYTLLVVADLAPIEVKEMNAVVLTLFAKTENAAGPLTANINSKPKPTTDFSTEPQPVRLVIEKIGTDAPVENPQSRDIAVLDAALLKGVVHYPGSGSLESNTNMFLWVGICRVLALVCQPKSILAKPLLGLPAKLPPLRRATVLITLGNGRAMKVCPVRLNQFLNLTPPPMSKMPR
ncbi:MAG: hypothetical protein CEO19_333 [Parcubacteria group bacterium Gr01-1014_73]|nr:MAG: hypothetical protein CEO19_333 [Parcubacteria group bacterium Gr01-1014_73]